MSAIVKQLRERREFWIELDEVKRLKARRPAEAEFDAFPALTGLQIAQRYVVGWEGFTEADLLDASVGSSDPQPFDQELWAEVVADRLDWISTVVKELGAAITRHIDARGLVEKN